MQKTPRTYIFYGLNAVRFLSVVGMILVFSSSITLMVKNINAFNAFEAAQGTEEGDEMDDCDYIEGSTIPNQAAGVFWTILSSLLIIFQTVILIMSEFGWPAVFFDRYFPVLGRDFGLGPLGIFQALIAAQMLSHHCDTFPLVAAFFLFSIACLNMLLGLIFRESAKQRRSITAWRSDAKGILPTSLDNRPTFVAASPAVVSSLFTGDSSKSFSSEKSGMGFGLQAEKQAGLRGYMTQRPVESLPRYATSTPPRPSSAEQTPTRHVAFSTADPDTDDDTKRGSALSYASHSRIDSYYRTNRRDSDSSSDGGSPVAVASQPQVFKSSPTAI